MGVMEEISEQNKQIIELLREIKVRLEESPANGSVQGALNVEEVAEIIGLSKEKVYALIREGKIEYIPIGSRRKIVPKKALKEWIESNTTKEIEEEFSLHQIS